MDAQCVANLAKPGVGMTEQEWVQCKDPYPMLELLRGKVSDRKLRLFACACCRRVWPVLKDERSRRAVEVAERLADNVTTSYEVEAAADAAFEADRGYARTTIYDFTDEATTAYAAYCTLNKRASSVVGYVLPGCDERTGRDFASLLRDIIGNPFRPVTLDPVWLTWNSRIVARLAEAAYNERTLPSGTLDHARLAVLADALEEAGCTDSEILSHCRGPGPHARGCWLVDALLGKT
jgi:hypothetical protein